MRAALWIIVLALAVLLFGGDKVRRLLGVTAADTAEQASAPAATPESRGGATAGDRKEVDPRAPSGQYAPSPAEAPELYDSPTRRFVF
jgi:hypothetical protein